MSELKPCPFCGGEAELCYSEVDIFCRKCNVMQETEMWNTRPIEDALQARAEKAEEMVERLIEAGDDLAGFTMSATGDNGHSITLRKWHALVDRIQKVCEE